MTPAISVVIPARNAAETIGAQLDALAPQLDDSVEVIVVDNGSTDSTRTVVQQYVDRIPRLHVVDASERIGINAARNAGVRHARGDRILLCDADDVVNAGWVEALSTALSHVDIAGGSLDERSLNTATSMRLRAPIRTHGLPVGGGFLPFAMGCNFGFTRDTWERIGGFDEAWRRGGTEVEFCWRAQLAGCSVGFAGRARVAYRYRATARASIRQAVKYAQCEARLYRSFRHAGMPRSRTTMAIKAWIWLVVHLPDLRADDERRSTWLRSFARRYGRLRGSLRYRVVYL